MAKNGSPRAKIETDEERSYFLLTHPIHERTLQLTPVIGVSEDGQAGGQKTEQKTEQKSEQKDGQKIEVLLNISNKLPQSLGRKFPNF